MGFKHPLYRILTIYVIVALVTLTPLSSLQQAAHALGLKGVLVGGLVGGAALMALGALAGPAGIVGAAGCAGTGFLGTLGGVIGAAVSGITGLCAATGTLGLGTLGTIGLIAGGAFMAVAGLGLSPWLVVPALALGGGLLAYSWSRNNRYGTSEDARYDGVFDNVVLDASSRLANQSSSGTDEDQGGFLDKVRSIFDRDRRDDTFFTNTKYVDSSGYVRSGTDFFSMLDGFLNGRNSGYSGYNSVYGTVNSLVDVNSRYSTSRTGQVTTLGSTTSRTSLNPGAPSETEGTIAEEGSGLDTDELAEAEAARKAAYERLIQAVKDNQTDGPAAASTSTLQSAEVQEAIAAYKEADRLVKEITGRLQDREKQ